MSASLESNFFALHTGVPSCGGRPSCGTSVQPLRLSLASFRKGCCHLGKQCENAKVGAQQCPELLLDFTYLVNSYSKLGMGKPKVISTSSSVALIIRKMALFKLSRPLEEGYNPDHSTHVRDFLDSTHQNL